MSFRVKEVAVHLQEDEVKDDTGGNTCRSSSSHDEPEDHGGNTCNGRSIHDEPVDPGAETQAPKDLLVKELRQALQAPL